MVNNGSYVKTKKTGNPPKTYATALYHQLNKYIDICFEPSNCIKYSWFETLGGLGAIKKWMGISPARTGTRTNWTNETGWWLQMDKMNQEMFDFGGYHGTTESTQQRCCNWNPLGRLMDSHGSQVPFADPRNQIWNLSEWSERFWKVFMINHY